MAATRQSADVPIASDGAMPRDLELWCVDLDAAGPVIARVWQRLSGLDDAASAQSQHRAKVRKAAADAALRCLLSAHVGVEVARQPFSRGPKGKPLIAGSEVHFSLSHCEGLALVAICRGAAVGIDVELARAVRASAHRRKQLEDAAESLAGQRLPSTDAQVRFLQAWVRLEAAAKATGEGIGALLMRLLPDRTPAGTRAASDPSPALTVYDIALPEAVPGVAALAVVGSRALPSVSVFPHELTGVAALIASRSAGDLASGGLQSTEDQRNSSPAAMLATYSGPSEWALTQPHALLLRV